QVEARGERQLRAHRGAPAVEEVVGRATGELLVRRTLVLEVEIERAGADVRGVGDLGRRRGVVAARAEDRLRRVQETRLGLLLPARRARREAAPGTRRPLHDASFRTTFRFPALISFR